MAIPVEGRLEVPQGPRAGEPKMPLREIADVKIIETRTGGCVWRRGPRQSGVRADREHDQERRACENLSNGKLRRGRRIRCE